MNPKPISLEDRDLFKQYLAEGNNPDAPGNFPAWLCKRKTVMAFEIDGFCIDIGTPANLAYVNENFDKVFGITGPVAEFIKNSQS